MKKIVKVTRTKRITDEIEVEFPFYCEYGTSFDQGGGYDSYTRVLSDLSYVTVTDNWGGDWEIEQGKGWDDFGPSDNRDDSTAEKFNAALDELQAVIDKVRATTLQPTQNETEAPIT
jgi:hypothetical protein